MLKLHRTPNAFIKGAILPKNKQFTIMATEIIEVLVSSASTGRAFTIFTEICPPGGGPPLHIHTREDEFFMPLEGEFETSDGERWIPLGKKGVYTKRGNMHTWRNSGTSSGKALFVASPGGLDEFLEELVPVETPQQLNEMISISAAYGITYPTLQSSTTASS